MSKKHKVRYEGDLRGVFDTHAHLYDRRYEEKSVSIEALLENASASGVDKIVIPSDSLATSKLASSMAREYNGTAGVSLWSSVGVHPHEASSYDGNVEEELKKLIEDKQDLRIVAVGEIGLDYYYDLSPRDVQKDVFEKQIKLSYESDLPFILHERDATGDCLEILRRAYKEGFLRSNPGVCHCCSMSKEAASELIRMGFYIGFDGPLTFANNRKGIELCSSCPVDRIVAETDSPYLTPEPNRGRTNEPGFVPFVIEKIAQIRGIDAEEMARITTENALRLYEI
ncbi:MAG: TatD family hydrolase [Clostridiales bacterium]|nr:TatD family hydrolase [Clostridiales bacterium]